MESIQKLMQEFSINTYEINDSCWVDVTHINDPHDFYVRPRSYSSYMPMLQAPGLKLKEADIQLGQKVIFKSKTTGSFVRGLVNYSEGSDNRIQFNILAVDYGFTEKGVCPSKVFNPNLHCPVPPLAMKCKLAQCQPLGTVFDDKAIDAMKHFIGKEKAEMVVHIKLPDVLVVALFNSMPDDVATLLALTGYTHLGLLSLCADKSIINPNPKKLYFQFENIKCGEKLYVTLVSGKSLEKFYVANITDYKEYINGKGNFSNQCKYEPQLTAEKLKVGEPVAVMDEYGGYERAIIKEITVPETKAIVYLVDLGLTQETHIFRLKTLKSEFYFQRHATAIFCAAETRQLSDNRFDKYLLPGTRLFVSIEQAGDGFQTPHIVSLLPECSQ